MTNGVRRNPVIGVGFRPNVCAGIRGIFYLQLFFFFLLPKHHCLNAYSMRMSSMSTPPNSSHQSPPVAKKVERVMEMFGDTRVDDYYWLRDDSRSNPEVLSYLRQENAYTESVMSGVKKFENQLYAEIKGRIKEDDMSVPLRRGSYFYYEKDLQGKEYVQHCRRLVPNSHKPPSVHDVMPSGPDAPPEHVILDENVQALKHSYYGVDDFEVSPNNKFVAYAEDTKGDEIYTLYIIDAETRSPVGQPILAATADLEWAGNEALAYMTMDKTHRPDKAWLHVLGTEQSNDTCLYHEKDDTFSLYISSSENRKYLFITSASKKTNFIFYLDVTRPWAGISVLTPRVYGTGSFASHRGNHFYITRRSDEFFNSEVVVCPVEDTSATTVIIPHSESKKLQDIQLFEDHLVVYQREGGLPKILVYPLPDVGELPTRLHGARSVEFPDPIYSVTPSESEFFSDVLRYTYSSMKTPLSTYDYDLRTGTSVLKKTEIVLGGFNSSNYVTQRKWASARDGTKIPISIVYRKDRAKLDGTDPLLLYGYGSYEGSLDPSFEAPRLSLLDRGFIYAIAHVRGGGEMGRQWYENGKLMKKKNTFTDFIASAEYLIKNKYCKKEKLCIEGRSAGGLLVGAVLNMRPDFFKVAFAGVPFVDVVTTMLDPTIPLTTSEWEEWGDPRKKEFYFYMKSYSSVDNVKAQNYPAILVTASLNDPRVLYSEPTKFVAKLRDKKTDKNVLLFKCELGAGHFSKSGRFEQLQEDAFKYAFIMKVLDMIPADE